MKKYIIRQINNILPTKMIRKQKFMFRKKYQQRHQRSYRQYSYKNLPKSNRFNRWQDYKRVLNKF